MAKTKKTAAEAISAFLNGRKRPVTAAKIADGTGYDPSTVRTALKTLNGRVKPAGRVYDGNVGRPPQTYVSA